MKNQRRIFYIGALLLALFLVGSILVFQQSNLRIQEGYLKSEGSAAENFAVLTAANIHLSNAQVEQLKNYSYDELLNSEENQALAAMMSNDSFATKVDYAYIMVHLKDGEVKYRVTEKDLERYDAPVGTKLDIMWLLDVNVSEEASGLSLNADDSELTRYSYYIEEDALIFGEAPTYIYNSSEWGDHICGYAPIYSTEGTYIGVIGVELQTSDYNAYCGTAVRTLGLLMTATLVMLTLIFFYIYRQYEKTQYEKIYTDALTKLGNRSYYNDRFIRLMNGNAKTSRTFALMIADIDWFKKVNDTFGHEIGDEVLIEMGEILLDTFGKKHTIRFGGEEFIVGIWIENAEGLRAKIDELYRRVREHKFTSQQITLSISMGCSYYDTSELNGWLMSGLLRAADCQLYECKENGRDQYRIDPFDNTKEYKKQN